MTRFRVSPRGSSRRRQALNEPDGTCTRIALWLWSGPHWGIFTPSTITARLAAGLSRSPDFQLHYGIELQDCSNELLRRDYSVEPPSNRTSLSPGIRLYGSWTLTAGEARPLSLIGSQVYRAAHAHLKASDTRFAFLTAAGLVIPHGLTIAHRQRRNQPALR
jgi:hypothetical protein